MEKMRYTTSDIGRQKRIAVEIFKIEGDFLASSTIMMLLATYQLASEETLEGIVEMTTKGVMSNKATIEVILAVTGKIMDQGFKDLMCPPRR
jgi:hypothetical protein